MSYICDCCNRRFDEPKLHSEYRETLESGYRVFEGVLGCPFCGGPYEEEPVILCSECGEHINDGTLCEDCIGRIDYQIGEILDELSEASRKAYCSEAERFRMYLMGCWRTYKQKEAEKKCAQR